MILIILLCLPPILFNWWLVTTQRWRELNPSSVRINDDPGSMLDSVASHLEVIKYSGTEMHYTSRDTQAIPDYGDGRERKPVTWST